MYAHPNAGAWQAHGGYTFCGVAAMALMDKLDLIDQRTLLVCSCGIGHWYLATINELFTTVVLNFWCHRGGWWGGRCDSKVVFRGGKISW